VIQVLRRLGYDVLTLHEYGLGNQAAADDVVLAAAHVENRAMLTLNRKHFWHLHDLGNAHSGVIACTFDLDFEGQARRIDAELIRYPEISGACIRVNRPPKSDQQASVT
jgi:hypothetical protein